MSIFSRLLAKKKKSEVEELFSEIQEESKLFEEFLQLHENKINAVKKIVPQWEEGNIDSIELVIKEIQLLNNKLWYLTNQILNIEKKEKSLFYFIIKEKMNQLDKRFAVYKQQKYLLDKKKFSDYSKELEPYFEQLFGFLKSLSKLILLQINTIKGWGKSAPARLAKDIIERRFFYHLLKDEAELDRKIKQHLILIIRTVNQFLGYQKRFGLRTKTIMTERGPREIITKGVIFHELKDPRSINFEKFYGLYTTTFPRDEREPKEALRTYISHLHLKMLIRGNATRNHLVEGIVKGEVIAVSFFSTYLAQDKKGRKIFFGVTWWEIVHKDYRGKRVPSQLERYRTKLMQADANSFGVAALDAIFIEVEDPRKMSPEQIKESMEEGINPNERVRFWQRSGFYKMKFDYMQPALGGGKLLDYLMLMIRPFNKDWIKKQGIPVKDMMLIFWYFVRYGFDRVPERDKTYVLNISNMLKSQVNGLVKFE